VQEVEGRRSEAEGGEDHLEGMIQSHDELITKMVEWYELNHLGENDEEEDEDDDDEGNAIAPPAPVPPAAAPKEIIKEEAPVEMVSKQEAPVVHEVNLADVEPEPRLFNMIMRDYEESPPRMENGPHELDDLDDLDDLTEVDYDVDE
jgi:hypothetical protein